MSVLTHADELPHAQFLPGLVGVEGDLRVLNGVTTSRVTPDR